MLFLLAFLPSVRRRQVRLSSWAMVPRERWENLYSNQVLKYSKSEALEFFQKTVSEIPILISRKIIRFAHCEPLQLLQNICRWFSNTKFNTLLLYLQNGILIFFLKPYEANKNYFYFKNTRPLKKKILLYLLPKNKTLIVKA